MCGKRLLSQKELSAQLTEDFPFQRAQGNGGKSPGLRATPFCERGLGKEPAGQPLFLLKRKQEPPAGGWLLFPHFTSERMSRFFIKYSTPE